MTERTFTQAQLLEVADSMRGGSGYANAINEVVAEILRLEEAARITSKHHVTPTFVPQGFKQICVCPKGINRGSYVIYEDDRHIWLPPEEARKPNPDLSQGIWASNLKAASQPVTAA